MTLLFNRKMKKIAALILCLILIAGLCSCNKSQNQDKTTATDSTSKKDENVIQLTDDQINTIGLKTEMIVRRSISGYIAATGQLNINKENEAKVSSSYPGKVMKVYVTEGQFVRQGQVLAILKNTDVPNVEANYIKAKSDYEYAKTEYTRQREAYSQNLGTQRDLSDFEQKYRTTLANLKAAEKILQSYNLSVTRLNEYIRDSSYNNITASSISVTSPIAGTIIMQGIVNGESIDPSKELFHIINTNTLWVDINIYDKDLDKVGAGQNAEVNVDAFPDDNFEGKVSFVNKIFNDNTRTVTARVNINNPQGKLIPLMFANAKIFTENAHDVLSAPVASVIKEDSLSFVFVQKDKNNFEKTEVKTGIEGDQFIEIISGVEQGANIVTDGIFYLKSAMMKSGD